MTTHKRWAVRGRERGAHPRDVHALATGLLAAWPADAAALQQTGQRLHQQLLVLCTVRKKAPCSALSLRAIS
jgi:hypothetical protein